MNQTTKPKAETVYIPMAKIRPNTGQINGLQGNPRFTRDNTFKKLIKSILENPEMLEFRELLVYPHDGGFVIIGGNMRYRAMKELNYKEAPCKIIPKETTTDKLRAYMLKDNSAFGEWDFEVLANEFDPGELIAANIDIPEVKLEETTEEEEEEESEEEDTGACEYMCKDVLYESDNTFEIPNLLLEHQAGKLELPLSPWGANSRLRKDVSTYHFYVDDYRFEALWKDPIKLITSGCVAIVEPNCSLHDQTPIAWGLQLIYKKRWLGRYMQECGVKVYADLNVSHKFVEYNKMGIPKGYNAFFTRGLDGWMDSLESDLQVAQEISGLEKPNLIVYGGGEKIKEFCRKKGLLYVTDFINAKKL